MITTGSTRGKCSAPQHSGSAATSRRGRCSVELPQLAQKAMARVPVGEAQRGGEERRVVASSKAADRVESGARIGVRLLDGARSAAVAVLKPRNRPVRGRWLPDEPPVARRAAGRPSRQTSWRASAAPASSASRIGPDAQLIGAVESRVRRRRAQAARALRSATGPLRRRGGRASAGRPRRGGRAAATSRRRRGSARGQRRPGRARNG